MAVIGSPSGVRHIFGGIIQQALLEDRAMHPRDFADDQTLYLTLAGMIYRQLQKCSDPALEKALNPFGLVLPYEARSAAVRNCWETVVKNALEGMGIIGSGSARDLHIRTKPAALELEDNESVIQ
jgi:hypothetical protein